MGHFGWHIIGIAFGTAMTVIDKCKSNGNKGVYSYLTIDDIDKKFYAEFQGLKLHLGIKSLEDVDINEYPEIASLKFSVKEVMDLLGEIDKQDKNNISNVKTEMDKLKEDMKDLQTQSKVIKNYGTSSVSSYGKDYQGFYIDGKK